jgi:hypothetical protein
MARSHGPRRTIIDVKVIERDGVHMNGRAVAKRITLECGHIIRLHGGTPTGKSMRCDKCLAKQMETKGARND